MQTSQTTAEKKMRQTFTGVVTSDKMKDTAVVTVENYKKHSKYQKYMTRRTKLMAHDPGNTKKIGDKATIEACRPISKNKAFVIVK
ncbi:MAG: 30S ribosomal protein S17 [Candidatus Paceibacterota bacterium]|jgi:small subunit ribosomal protein S17